MMIMSLSILLVITIVGFVIAYILLSKKIQERNRYAVFLSKKIAKRDRMYTIYRFLSYQFFTRRTVKKIKIRYDTLFVGDEKKAAIETVKIVLSIFAGCVFVTIFVLVNKVGLYGTALAFLMIYILQNEIVTIFVEKQEWKILMQLERYIADLRRFYFRYNMIEFAIEEANEVAKYEMKLHGEKIYQVITSSEKEEEIILYNDQIKNRFLKILLAICSTTLEFGDKRMANDETVLLYNLKELGKEVSIEKLKIEKRKNVYMGTSFLTIFPIFTIPLIKNWAINNVSELYAWYNGVQGILVLMLLFLTTLIVYQTLNWMKEPVDTDDTEHVLLEKLTKLPYVSFVLDNLEQRNYGKTLQLRDRIKHSGSNLTVKEFFVKQILTGILCFVIGCFITNSIHSSVKELQLYYVDNISISSSVRKEQESEIKELVKIFTSRYCEDKEIIDKKDRIKKEMQVNSKMKNEYIFELLVQEVIERVSMYQEQYVKSYEVFLWFLLGILGYMLPSIALILKEQFIKMQMEDEVIQFQSIIIMLMHFERINTKMILEWMENFSLIFHDSIQTCVSNFSNGEQDALETLKDEEPFDPFVRIIENLEQADRVGIQKAFNEILVDRQNYQEKRKQENEISLKNRGAIAGVIAMLPLVTTILLYLGYPFVIESLKMLQRFTNELQ